MSCLADPPRTRALVAAALILSLGQSAPASGIQDYLRAEQALKSGDRETFVALDLTLQDYPLYPYLRFADLTRQRDGGSDAAIESFLNDYPDTPLAERLRATYLKRLAAAGRWADYARVYRPDESAERRCLYLRALLQTGRGAEALTPANLDPLWQVPRSQPGACDPLFDAWAAAGGLDTTRIWARIRLALAAGETGLARHLGERLPESERPWLERWLALRARPERIADPATLAGVHPLRPAMLADALARLARQSPVQAAERLESAEIAAALRADPAAWDLAHGAVGRALARRRDAAERTRGLALWDRMSAQSGNLADQEARVRAAIALEDWERVAAWIARMPDGEEKRDRWLYWQGRAQLALGREVEGLASLRQAATRRSLWGFLAADRLGLPYNLTDRPTPAEPDRLERIAGHPALARIRELKRLGREADMRREWRTLTRDLEPADLMAAAVVAQRLGWYDQAIFTLARTGYWDDLALRFPLAYRDRVAEQSWQTGLPEDWILAVIRQESVFAPQVASAAGALGLMQLMPATARALASEPEVALSLESDAAPADTDRLLNPADNIALGSVYLSRMRDRFGHAALATAAYNAGPNRVERWRPDSCMDADRWIVGIPFEETRGYVERVLAYRAIYAARLGESEPVRVSALLPPVTAAAAGAESAAGD